MRQAKCCAGNGRAPLAPRLTDADREAHRAFIATLGDKPIWNEYLAASQGA